MTIISCPKAGPAIPKSSARSARHSPPSPETAQQKRDDTALGIDHLIPGFVVEGRATGLNFNEISAQSPRTRSGWRCRRAEECRRARSASPRRGKSWDQSRFDTEPTFTPASAHPYHVRLPPTGRRSIIAFAAVLTPTRVAPNAKKPTATVMLTYRLGFQSICRMRAPYSGLQAS